MILDPKDPFYAPAWRRVAIVGVLLAWGVFELVIGNTLWAALFGCGGAWVAWVFIRAGRED